METIATPYELQAMVDGPKLPARTSNDKTNVVVVTIFAISGTIL